MAGAVVGKLVFLKTCEASNLANGERLMILNLPTYLRKEAGDEAAEEKRWRNVDNPIC